MASEYARLDDRQLLNELGRKLAQITHARNVGNEFMATMYEGHKREIFRECASRDLLEDAKEKEICG